MAEESSVSEVAEREVPVANGGVPHKSSGPVTEKKDNESNRVDKMEIDSKDEERADPEKEDAEAKVDMEEKKEEEPKDVTKQEDNNGDKEEKEEDVPESAAMDLDKDGREDKKEEEPEKAAVEENSVLEAGEDTNKNNDEIEGSKETQEKVDGLDKELEKAGESREKNEEKNLEEDIEKNDEEMAEERNEKKDEEHKENEEDEEGEEKAEEIKEEIKEEKADKEEPGESKEDKGSKKGRSRKNAAGKVREKKKLKQEVEQRTPVTDRPVRERKSVERLVATIEKDANKEIHIEKGRGTPLKDIPNVAYKLARRKPDDTFKLLHSVMFGRRVKAFQIKGNISRFSGFVWHDDEEKQRSKVKEKFDKSTKEKLLEVCDILDIPIAKATTRKEDIIVKLIDFLVAPHATTPVLLAEKESGKGQKRKRGMKRSSSTPRSGSSNRAAKSRTKGGEKAISDSDDSSEDEKEEEHGTDEEKTVNGVSEESDHGKQDQFESEEESSSEDESGDDSGKKKKQKSSSKKKSAGRAKSNKIEGSEMTSPPPKSTKRSSAKRSKVDDDSEVSPTPRKKNDSGVKKASAKSASKERTVRKTSKGKDKAKDEKAGPSIDKLRDAICEILKEVDFNTATFTDILKQLAKKFDTDLTPRKSAIKLMIQEELTKLADEADDEEDADGGAGKDEMAVDGTEVKA